MSDYESYEPDDIRLKLEEDDGELTQVMTGYPAWKDEIYSESLEEQKEK